MQNLVRMKKLPSLDEIFVEDDESFDDLFGDVS